MVISHFPNLGILLSVFKKLVLLLVFICGTSLTACRTPAQQKPIPTDLPNTANPPVSTRVATAVVPVEPTSTSSPAPLLLGTYTMVTPEDMRLDLDELFYKLEMTHPNLYAYRAKASVDLDRQRLSDELTQAMTVIDFYKKAALLINRLADYHTRLSLSREALVVIEQTERFFPFGLQVEGQRAYINANFSGDDSIKFGTELLEVNGMPVSEILDRSKQYEPFGRNISPITCLYQFGR